MTDAAPMPDADLLDFTSPAGRAHWQDVSRRLAAEVSFRIAECRRGGAADIDILTAETRAAYARFDAAVAPHEPLPVACRRGCCECCYLTVSVTFGEALTVAGYVVATRPDLIPRLEATAARVATYADRDARRRAVIPCAFLEADGSCAVYPVRPMACRGANSPDARLCGPRNDPEGVNLVPYHVPTRKSLLENMLDLTVLNNLVTGRRIAGEFLNGVMCGLEALRTRSLAAFASWFAHADDDPQQG